MATFSEAMVMRGSKTGWTWTRCVDLGVGTLVGALFLLASCASPAGSGDADGVDDLTTSEMKAILAAGEAPQMVAQSTSLSQNSTTGLDEEATEPVRRDDDGVSAGVGTCPSVTRASDREGTIGDGDGLNLTTASLTLDFGDTPCAVITVEDGGTLECAGSATGSIDVLDRSFSLAFEQLTCNGETIDGDLSVAFELLAPGLGVTGDWDLSWTDGESNVGTAGAGTGSYVPVLEGCCDVTSIDTYVGTVRDDEDEWSCEMTAIEVSFEQYESFIPFGGSVVVDGPDIRPITVTFNENSPVTGDIAIQIGSGRTFHTTLEELANLLQ